MQRTSSPRQSKVQDKVQEKENRLFYCINRKVGES